jgi:prefoldin subunit 5
MEQEELNLKSYLYQLVKHRVQDEMQLFNDKLKGLEKRIEALEQESRELNKRIERIEQTQRSVTEVVIRI